ncbi:NAD(P)-dependent oxidoreductase [Sinomonas atrocyanea]|uniref:NAD(P)-dependent oxidoreductase n=1 Tax=Sinomonas atrocyanea TaxID=37927 RepID=UPI002780EBE2|nr:NAD(P)-dependent oxidoreductase [Sinomonas atrocyanea]MDQ0259509.1 2-hydroxy-3-oxopropionate reductase [Sinomonas atrocyanea]MDR6623349.1 2-hydroxy-3-oxopropionate reductase [Sinomonas atrocyanea]
MTEQPAVSLLGLGRMGLPTAERLLESLGSLTVWNRTASKADALAARGARLAASPADAAADIALTVLTDLSDVEDVLRGEDGLLAGWHRAKTDHPVLVVHGTVSPTEVAELAQELAMDGIGVVDAPLSGGVAGAESGTLSVMVGGQDWAVAKAMPVLENVGATVIHFGRPGNGEIAKACNQVIVASTVTAISEALVLADAWGLDRAQLLRIFGGGLANSEVLRQKRDRWLTGDFTGGGSAVNQLKDLRFAADTAAAKGLRLPVSQTLKDVFEQMIDEGLGDLDHSAVELTIAGTIEKTRSTAT